MEQQQTDQWDVPFGVPMSMGPLRIIVSFMLFFIFMKRNHIDALIFSINTYLEHHI